MLEYIESDGRLVVHIDGKRYMISQMSGEFLPADGYGISDYYWSNVPESAEKVRKLFEGIANAAAELARLQAQNAKLVEALDWMYDVFRDDELSPNSLGGIACEKARAALESAKEG